MHGLPDGSPAKKVWPDAAGHLKTADPVVAEAIDRVGGGPPEVHVLPKPFEALARAIIHQQRKGPQSEKLAAEVAAMFDGEFPTPGEVLKMGPKPLRSLGLPESRAKTIWRVANLVATGDLDLNELPSLSDEEVMERLQAVKGVGPWTARMYLVYNLERPDVLMKGDSALRAAVEEAYDLPEDLSKEEFHEELERIAEAWEPYRSAAAWFIWKGFGGFDGGL